ncbi:MAG: hypothetical protein AAB532_04230 [Patescibacteria group bacterium]
MITAEGISVYRPPDIKDLPGFNVQEVRVAGNRGACGGVEMTLAVVNQVMEVVPQGVDVWTTNNPVNFPPAFAQWGERLKNAKGDISKVPNEAVLIISAHGVSPEVIAEAEQRGMVVIDTTCPFVLDEQNKVRQTAAEGLHSIFLGEENHPETIGIVGQVLPEMITVFDPGKRIPDQPIPDNARVFAKTTNDPAQTQRGIRRLTILNSSIDASDAHSCYALKNRFAAGKQMIGDVDFWLVVGDQTSHNAKGLRRISRGKQVPSSLVRGPEDIKWSRFKSGIEVVGVSSAASVPEEHTQRVLEPFRQLGVNVVELPQAIPEAYRMFRLPEVHLQALQQRFA